MLDATLRSAGLRVRRIECGDTWTCERMLIDGHADVMVEYTGTGRSFAGLPLKSSGDPLAELREAYEPLGLRWLDRLGFDNGFRLVTTKARAPAGAASLRTLPNLRLTIPKDFEDRPADGLGFFLRRFRLELRDRPAVIGNASARYDALREGRADAVVGYATDGALMDEALISFAPEGDGVRAYEAVILARADLLANEPAATALRSLKGRIETGDMQRMNREVERFGHSPDEVAHAFLASEGVIDASAASGRLGQAEIVLATSNRPFMSQFNERAVRAVRTAWPAHRVRVVEHGDPAGEVLAGRARLAVAGAERFFDSKKRAVRGLEAVVALGHRGAAPPALEKGPAAGAKDPAAGAPLRAIGAQVLLAARAPRRASEAGTGGPTGAVDGGPPPIEVSRLDALARGAGVAEPPHPALPSARTLLRAAPAETTRAGAAVLDTTLNVLTCLFLAWLGVLVFRREG